MAHYYNITKQQIEEVLTPQGFKQISLPRVSELVYGKRVDRDGLILTLRVFTGIDQSGQSREVGKDAIRVAVFTKMTNGDVKLVGGSKRVHRVEGWKHNLQNRIDNFADQLGPKCSCGCLMMERKGKNGKFWGCTNYPACHSTKPLEKVAS